ncbi:MAG: winged helix DNA-binding domain-containing protein [Chloroflexi bacterium]|nr:winged helix DNA-binding domain-containing protein [Chloroflexota bacterium]
MTVKSLKWHQVNAWRLSQHGLSPRLKRQDYVKAVTRTGGIQAQVMSAAEWALGARVDGLTPQDVQAALWQERTLVKTWAMRATLHLITASELPLYAAARSTYEARNWLKYFTYYGITPAQYEAFLAAVPQILGSEPMTREQLAAAVAKHIGAPELGRLLLSSSWGSLWKPSAWRGDLCFGPNQGRNVTFVRPSQWIGQWQPVEPYPALQEMARRYLRAYGPATPGDFARWWDGGAGIGPARKLFQSIEDELEAVEVEGWRAVALRTTLEPMQRLATTAAVRLLPLFDAYVLGLGRALEPLLPKAYVSQVFRPQGWISAVVLVDGYMKGVWEYQSRRAQTIVKVQMFSTPTAAVRRGIEAEAERLSAFLNTKVVLEKEDH